MIALGSDHGGFELKETIKSFLQGEKIQVQDFGTFSNDSVDYPLYAEKVVRSIQEGKSQTGILCCGTGIGISIAANKFSGIRAALCTNEFCTEMSRRHNNANILCLGGRVIEKDLAIKIVKIFINTPFDGGRHEKRLAQITEFEKLRNL